MERPLAVRDLSDPGLLRRWTGRPLPENACVEIENLLALKAWIDIEPDEIVALLKKHGSTSLKPEWAKKLFEKALQTCVMDDVITPEEVVGLDRLQDLLGLRDKDVREIQQRVTHPRFQMALADVFRDGTVTKEEARELTTLRKALRIDERAAREIWNEDARQILQQTLEQAVSDEQLDSAELAQLELLAKNFRVVIDHDSATQTQLARFRWFWLMENGTFPEVEAPIALHKNEVCHFSCTSTHHEMRSETMQVNYGSPSARIRIMKGVYYRFGSVQAQRITRNVLKQIDSGTLYVTSKRLIFDGMRKNTVIRLSNILTITPYSDALEVEKTSGRNAIFTLGDPEWLSVLLSSLLAQNA